jgi:hypothetical protein
MKREKKIVAHTSIWERLVYFGNECDDHTTLEMTFLDIVGIFSTGSSFTSNYDDGGSPV